MSDGSWNSNQKWLQFTNTSSPWALLQDSTIAFLGGRIPHILYEKKKVEKNGELV